MKMRLLIVNYELDEDSRVLAWQASVVQKLAIVCEYIVVFTEKLGKFDCPNNVKVFVVSHSPWGLPKFPGARWLHNFTLAYVIKLYKIDACFVHMAMEWTYVLAPTLKIYHIPILLWYAHGHVSNRLKVAHMLADAVVTSTSEGFRLLSRKKHVIGQGINTDLFRIPEYANNRNEILYVGRISRRKRIALLLDVMISLRRIAHSPHCVLRIIGPTLTQDDTIYFNEVKQKIQEQDLESFVKIVSDVPSKLIPDFYKNAFLHLNVSKTGSMDKTVLEALACGCPVLTSNEAFIEIFRSWPDFFLNSDETDFIASKVLEMYIKQKSNDPILIRNIVVGHHDIDSYINKIMQNIEEIL